MVNVERIGNVLRKMGLLALSSACLVYSAAQQAPSASAPETTAHRIGTIKAINRAALTLVPDSGPEINVSIQPTTRLLRIAPGQKDLRSATPIQIQELQVGDRVLAGGKFASDNSSFVASTIIVMTHSDLEARHRQELEDWHTRGIDGPVTAVDAAGGTVTITSRGKPVVIRISDKTIVRRYAPDSVKFDDAKASTLAAIHPGDQLRARGERNPEGTELTADEIVSGAFRNIAGMVNSVDLTASTVSVHDLLTNKNLTVKITPDSQVHQLPAEMAQHMAMRLKRNAGGGGGENPGPNLPDGQQGGSSQDRAASAVRTGAAPRRGGVPDLQQILSRTPAVSLKDLHKGEAVIALSTEGTAETRIAITLLTGVEPILEAAPNASGASILTPWSLGAPSGDSSSP